MAIAMTLANGGIDRRMKLCLNKAGAAGNLTLKLYKNNHTPVFSDTPADYTEPTATGYAAVAMVGANWTGATVAGLADYDYPAVTFTFTDDGGGETIYGVFIVDSTGALDRAGLLDTEFVIPAGGGTVTINVEYKSEQCP